MNRSKYFDLCEEKLTILCASIELRGKLNVLNFHNHAENFYLHFLNKLYNLKLENMNEVVSNAEGIDLRDGTNKIVLQVSSTATKQKIESALTKDLSAFKGYGFKFVSISKDASDLRAKSYNNPHQLIFVPKSDIYDVSSLLKKIMGLSIVEQQSIYRFLRSEIDPNIQDRFVDTHLADVINILSNEDLSDGYDQSRPIPFNVDAKIEYNSLVAAAIIVEDFKIHHYRLEKIYAEFDRAGKNKSNSILHSLRSCYARLSTHHAPDELFFKIVEMTIEKIQQSANFIKLPLDELEQYVNVLTVDAFIRCKIFKKPE